MKVKEYFEKLGWNKNPFTLEVSPDIFIGYEEQRNAVINHVEEGQKISLVTGPTGAGKTTLLLWTKKYLENEGKHIVRYVPKPPKTVEEFVPLFLEIFPMGFFERIFKKPPTIYSLPDYINRKINGKSLVMLIDEAHETDKDILEWLRVLVDQNPITLIVAGLPKLEYKIKNELETFDHRITTRVFLEHLSEEEVYELIEKRIKWAGGEGIKPFTPEAIKEIHFRTNGFPREVLKLCDALIHEAAEKEEETISEFFVKSFSGFKEEDKSNIEEAKVTFQPKPRTEIKDLPAKQRRVLEVLSKHNWLTPTQIVNQMGYSGYKTHHHAIRSVNNILKRLMMEGYVQREARGKAYVYSLTPRARAYFVES